MFQNCSNLNSVTCLATNISATNCTTDWLKGVATTGIFTKAPSMASWTSGASGIPTGWAVFGQDEFSVSSTKKVYFSPGNLQYIGSAAKPYWKFAVNQWEYFGNQNGNAASNIDRDLFGWGTSGYNHGATCYQPWSTTNQSYTNYYYAYGQVTANLSSNSGQADWGYNAISNGGNRENSGWRVLTAHSEDANSEWWYLLNGRQTGRTVNGTNHARYTYARVNTDGTGVNGLIVFPDNYAAGTPAGVTWGTINNKSSWTTTCTTAGWAALAAAGCVLLPAGGCRNGLTVSDLHTYGYYWGDNPNPGDNKAAYGMRYYIGDLGTPCYFWRSSGLSVRLVKDAN